MVQADLSPRCTVHILIDITQIALTKHVYNILIHQKHAYRNSLRPVTYMHFLCLILPPLPPIHPTHKRTLAHTYACTHTLTHTHAPGCWRAMTQIRDLRGCPSVSCPTCSRSIFLPSKVWPKTVCFTFSCICRHSNNGASLLKECEMRLEPKPCL